MRTINNIKPYIVSVSTTVLDALNKINENTQGIVFVVDEGGHLCGAMSDGDFRRWLIKTTTIDLTADVAQVMNANCISMPIDTSQVELEISFDERFSLLPLVDDTNRVVAVAVKDATQINIDEFQISETNPCFIIAEIGNNHNGDIALAKKLVDLAIEAGADCVKFQMRDMASLYKNNAEEVDHSADLGAQYVLDLLSKFQLSNDELFEVFDYCKSKNVTPMCTPWDEPSLHLLEGYGMLAYKVASADLTNLPFLQKLAATGKPLICSTGMSTEIEIKQAIAVLKQHASQFILLHCNSTYPAPFKDINLSYLTRLKELSGGLVGYSGHERGTLIPAAAVSLGAKVIEKHFTVDKTMQGSDHKVSLLPEEFAEMVRSVRTIEESMGSGQTRELSQGELINRESLAKSLISNCKIKQGQRISRDMIEVRSPGQGLQPNHLETLIGKTAKRDFDQGGYFYLSDIQDGGAKPRDYQFDRPFGIPVRYHDYQTLSSLTNLDFVEFHLSYQDMNVDIDTIFDKPQKIGFAVHAPELFANDHILDLASDDPDYLQHSLQQLQQVVDITNSLKKYFPKTEKPVIVVNAGGFSETTFLDKQEKLKLYPAIADSLNKINQDGVEIIIQTMPPFPWHFGGQRHHNLFVSADEIVDFCDRYNYRICYDVSHSMMACNYYGWELQDFTTKVGPYIAHMHIVDAKGSDGEGIEVGKGDVNFYQLAKDLNTSAPNIQFIPEVWQGHRNSGEGFWHALEYLEQSMTG